MAKIVRADFERNPLTHTVTHITTVCSGQGCTNSLLLITKAQKFENPLGISLQKFLLINCANPIASPWVRLSDSTQGFVCFLCFVSYRYVVRCGTVWRLSEFSTLNEQIQKIDKSPL